MKKNLILGIGNDILTDDGIGPRLIDLIQKSCSFKNTDFFSTTLGGLEILEFIIGYEKVIFIDAIRTEKGIPGSVNFFNLSDFQETLHLSNLHDISFLTAIDLGKTLGFKIPEDMRIIAIEIVEDKVFSKEFSPEIENQLPVILENVKKLINSFI